MRNFFFCLLIVSGTCSHAVDDVATETCENKQTSTLEIGHTLIFKAGEITIDGTRTPPRQRLVRRNDTVNITYNQITCIFKKPDSNKPWKCYADLPGGVYIDYLDINCEKVDGKSNEIMTGSCSLEYSLSKISTLGAIVFLFIFLIMICTFPEVLVIMFLFDDSDSDSGSGSHTLR